MGGVTPVNAAANSKCVLLAAVAAGRPHTAKVAAQMASVTNSPIAAAAAVVGRCLLRCVLRRSRYEGVVLPTGLPCPRTVPLSRSRCSSCLVLRSAVHAVGGADGLVT